MKIFVELDHEHGILTNASLMKSSMSTVEVELIDEAFYFGKMQGYEIDQMKTPIEIHFNQEKYDKYVKEENDKITNEKARAEFNHIFSDLILGAATDEQALKMTPLYPQWNGEGVKYTKGERVQYLDVLYKVLQDHTSQPDWAPKDAPSLFARVLVTEDTVIPEWEQPDSTNGYAKGDKVTHNGKVYESLKDDNVDEPSELSWASWAEVE